MEPTDLEQIRILNLNLGNSPLLGYDLKGAWTELRRDLSHLGLRETKPGEGEIAHTFTPEAIYSDNAGSRWWVIKDQEERWVLLHESRPVIPYAKGDPICWHKVPGEIAEDQRPPPPGREPWVFVRLHVGTEPYQESSLPTSEIRLRAR